MAHSTANWHWKTKYVGPWAKEWFSKELAGASAEQEDGSVTVVRVTELEGDVEIGQRKSKYVHSFSKRDPSWHWTELIDSPTQTHHHLRLPSRRRVGCEWKGGYERQRDVRDSRGLAREHARRCQRLYGTYISRAHASFADAVS